MTPPAPVHAEGLDRSPGADSVEVSTSTTVTVVIDASFEQTQRLQEVLGAHLRAFRLEPFFAADIAEPRGGALIVLTARDGEWSLHVVGRHGDPIEYELAPAEPASASDFETFAQAASSMVQTVLLEQPEPEPKSKPKSEAETVREGAESSESLAGASREADRPERAPEPETAGTPPAPESDRMPRKLRWAQAPRRDAFNAQLGWSAWLLDRSTLQNGANLQLGWTFRRGLTVGVAAAFTQGVAFAQTERGGEDRLEAEDVHETQTQLRRWPVHATLGYRVVIGQRLDLLVAGLGGLDTQVTQVFGQEERDERGTLASEPQLARSPVPYVGATASFGVWTGGPVSLRARAGVEVPLVTQQLDLSPARVVTGLEMQFGVGREGARRNARTTSEEKMAL